MSKKILWIKSFHENSLLLSLKNMFYTYHGGQEVIYHNSFKSKKIFDKIIKFDKIKELNLVYECNMNDSYTQYIYANNNYILYIESSNNHYVMESLSIDKDFYEKLIDND